MRLCRCHQRQHPAKVSPPCSLTSQSRVRPQATSPSSYLQTKFQRQQNTCILSSGEKGFCCKGWCFHRILLGFVCDNGTSGKSMQGEKFDDANFFLNHRVLASCPWQILGQHKQFPVFHLHRQDRMVGRHTQVTRKRVQSGSRGALWVKAWQDQQEAHNCPLWTTLVKLTCVLT